MEETYISLATAKLAKEKGFNQKTYYHYSEKPVNDLIILVNPDDPQVGQGWVKENYNNNDWILVKYSAPTQSLLQKWLRENHNIQLYISFDIIDDSESAYIWSIRIYVKEGIEGTSKKDEKDFWTYKDSFSTMMWYKTFEEALEIGLQEALKLIKIK